ncbi:hypothetical protein HYX10_05515 [Candidatus Woesearchaeota archaeon]|nr:hypothetical protein [Candidatus Woesearchaeota archaeon]
MDKKGLVQSKTAGFVLVLIALVLWLAWTGKFSMVAEDLSVTEQCRASVIRNARYHVAGLDLGGEIDCPERSIDLKGKSQQDAKQIVADAMYTCAKQFGRGQLNLFKEEGVYCNVCYVIDVNTEKPIENFGDYLMTTPSPAENLYYQDYLAGFKTDAVSDDSVVNKFQKFFNRDLQVVDELELQTVKSADIKNNEKYAVIFVYAKGGNYIKKMVRQLAFQGAAGRTVTTISIGSAAAAGTSVGLALVATPAVPVVIVAGAAVAAGAAVFTATEFVGSLFSPDSPPDWAAFTVLRPWNVDETPDILTNELGCTRIV